MLPNPIVLLISLLFFAFYLFIFTIFIVDELFPSTLINMEKSTWFHTYITYYYGMFVLHVGFTNGVLKACCGGEGPYNFNILVSCGQSGSTVCKDPSTFANWDGVHLTEAAYRVIVQALINGTFITPPLLSWILFARGFLVLLLVKVGTWLNIFWKAIILRLYVNYLHVVWIKKRRMKLWIVSTMKGFNILFIYVIDVKSVKDSSV